MSVLSLASVLDDPAKQIPIYAMVRAAAVSPAKDDALFENMRAEHFSYREQIRRLDRMDSDAYRVAIENLARSLDSLDADSHKAASRAIFGDPYAVELNHADAKKTK